jgi:hypothetical protein
MCVFLPPLKGLHPLREWRNSTLVFQRFEVGKKLRERQIAEGGEARTNWREFRDSTGIWRFRALAVRTAPESPPSGDFVYEDVFDAAGAELAVAATVRV